MFEAVCLTTIFYFNFIHAMTCNRTAGIENQTNHERNHVLLLSGLRSELSSLSESVCRSVLSRRYPFFFLFFFTAIQCTFTLFPSPNSTNVSKLHATHNSIIAITTFALISRPVSVHVIYYYFFTAI
jgi:hypothetical protein